MLVGSSILCNYSIKSSAQCHSYLAEFSGKKEEEGEEEEKEEA